MIITEISIDSFGALQNIRLEPFSKGLILFFGSNEAGKSTILAFIRSIFFGFPSKHSNIKKYEPPNPGIFGGNITIKTDFFGPIIIERRASYNGKKLKKPGLKIFSKNSGKEISHKEIFGGITQKLYENVFAFGLDELQRLDLLTHEEIKEAIYGASLGSSFLMLPKAQKIISKKIDELFKPYGKKQPINLLLREFSEINSEIKKGKDELLIYNKLQQEINNEQEDINKITSEYKRCHQKLVWFKAIEQSFDDYIKLRNLLHQKNRLQKVINQHTLTERVIFTAERLNDEIENIKLLIDQKKQELEIAKNQINNISFNAKIINLKNEIQHLYSKKEKFITLLDNIEDQKKKLTILNKKLDDIIKKIGVIDDKSKIENFKLSLYQKNKLNEIINSYNQLKQKENDLIHILDLRKKDLKNKYKEITKIKEELKKFSIYKELSENDIHELLFLIKKAKFLQEQWIITSEKYKHIINNIELKLKQLNISISIDEFKQSNLKKLQKLANELFNKHKKIQTYIKQLEQQIKIETIKKEQIILILKEKQKTFNKISSNIKNEDSIKKAIELKNKLLIEYPERFLIDEKLSELDEKFIKLQKTIKETEIKRKTLFFYQLLIIIFFGIIISSYYYSILPINFLFVISLFLIILFISTNFKKNQLHNTLQSLLREKQKLQQKINNLNQVKQKIDKIKYDIFSLLNIKNKQTNISHIVTMLDELEETINIKNNLKIELESLEKEHNIIQSTIDKLKKEKLDNISINKQIINHWNNLFVEFKIFKSPYIENFSLWMQDISNLSQQIDTSNNIKIEMEKLEKRFTETIAANFQLLPSNIDIYNVEALKELEKTFQNLLIELNKKHKIYEQILEKKSQINQIKQEIISIISNKRVISKKQKEILDVYYQLIGSLDLGKLFPIEIINEIIELIYQYQEILNEKTDIINKQIKCQIEIDNITFELKELFKIIDKNYLVKGEYNEFEYIFMKLNHEKENKKNWELLKEKIEYLTKEIDKLNTKLNSKNKKLKEIFSKHNAQNIKELKNYYETSCKVAQLNNDINKIMIQLTSRLGCNEEDIFEIFNKYNLVTIKNKIKSTSEQIDIISEKLQKAHERQANRKHEIDRLKNSQNIQNLLNKKEILKKELYDLSKKWAVFTVSKLILDLAKEKFEKENQPEVLSRASKYFESITGKRYRNIIFQGEKNELIVRNGQGKTITVDKLSRGTKEQLYLSLRLGIIPSCEPKNEKMPIIMDDILVNFDYQRMKRTAYAIYEMSKYRQVLFFTCHQNIKNAFLDIDSDIQLINLDL